MEPPAALSSPKTELLLAQCIHCGLCLPACPTYAVLQSETDSPRGRIQLMAAAAQGRIDLDGAFRTHIDLCLGCRACETACPSGVQYGSLLEAARAGIEEKRKIGQPERIVRRLALRELMPNKQRLRLLARGLVFYQRLGISKAIEALGVLPPRLRSLEALLPPLTAVFPNYSVPAPAMGKRRGRVAFLYGCVQDAFLGNVNAASIRVLQRNGYEVHFPQTQTCCGAAALHMGENDLALDLARRNIDAVELKRYDAIISNAGGCGATLKEYGRLLANDPAYAQRAQDFAAKVQDISEFLAVRLHATPTGRIDARVTYADSCHLRHVQHVVNQPRRLLQQIPGIELIEMAEPGKCCGSAGVYNIIHSETADLVLDAKMADIRNTGAEIIVTTNTGCHMQYIYGVKRAGLNMRVVHLVELLDWSYANHDTTDGTL
ncbi:MAG: 4Fe-4S dicluster domain-containing protein [Caldilineaceae bacterium]|nr:4Fe-4S dicluster domain-containing protein [Caldilineaceae bacterium]